MKVITLPDMLHDYLVHVLLTYHAHPEEGIGMAQLWDAVSKKATHIDDSAVQKMAQAGTPTGQSAPRDQEYPEDRVPGVAAPQFVSEP